MKNCTDRFSLVVAPRTSLAGLTSMVTALPYGKSERLHSCQLQLYYRPLNMTCYKKYCRHESNRPRRLLLLDSYTDRYKLTTARSDHHWSFRRSFGASFKIWFWFQVHRHGQEADWAGRGSGSPDASRPVRRKPDRAGRGSPDVRGFRLPATERPGTPDAVDAAFLRWRHQKFGTPRASLKVRVLDSDFNFRQSQGEFLGP